MIQTTLPDQISIMAHFQTLLFKEVENSDIKVNPHCVACFGKIIAHNIIQISELIHEENNGK